MLINMKSIYRFSKRTQFINKLLHLFHLLLLKNIFLFLNDLFPYVCILYFIYIIYYNFYSNFQVRLHFFFFEIF